MVERKRNEQGPLNAEQRKKLRGFVEEIERTEDEIDRLKLDLKGVYEAVKETGLDVKVLKEIVQDRKQPFEQLALFEETKAAYRLALTTDEERRQQHRATMIDRPFAPPLDA